MPDKPDKPSFMSRTFPDVTPLQQNKLGINQTNDKKPRPAARQNRDEFDAPPLRLSGDSTVGANDALNYQANGLQNRVMRDLKRGKFPRENQLDLHGKTVEQAHLSCMEFIQHCQQRNYRCVLIIHGQGYRSSGGIPVLKQQVDYWLRQHEVVQAFCSAQQRDGGRGAIYVLLRKN